MSNDPVFDKVKEIVAGQLPVEEDDVTLVARLVEDLGADSTDQLELALAAAVEFDFEIPEDEDPQFTTVQEFVNYIKNRT